MRGEDEEGDKDNKGVGEGVNEDGGEGEGEGASKLSKRSFMPPGKGARSIGEKVCRYAENYSKNHSLYPQKKRGYIYRETGGVYVYGGGVRVYDPLLLRISASALSSYMASHTIDLYSYSSFACSRNCRCRRSDH